MLETTGEEWAHFCDNEVNKEKLTEEEIKYVFGEIVDKKIGGSTYRFDCGSYMVLIKDPNLITYYLHELYHCVNCILQDRGVEHHGEDEPYAYLIGWMSEQYSYLLKEFNKEKEQTMTKEEKEQIIKELSIDRGYLQDWYQQSIDETQPPIWTDEHLDELYNDFYLIPKR